MRQFLNRWGSTLVFASFAITAATGVLLYFRIHVAPIEQLHIWIGFLLIAGVLLHVARNWHQALCYFRRPPVYAALALTAVICAYLAWPAVFGTASEAGRPDLRAAFIISRVVSNASLADLAPLAGTDADGLMTRLSDMGIAVSDPAASLPAIARAAGKTPQEIAAALLAAAGDGAASGGK